MEADPELMELGITGDDSWFFQSEFHKLGEFLANMPFNWRFCPILQNVSKTALLTWHYSGL
jgi:hypothetical protein